MNSELGKKTKKGKKREKDKNINDQNPLATGVGMQP